MKLRLRSTFEQVRFSQEFQVFAGIVSAAFGGTSKKNEETNVLAPKNSEEAKWMLAKVLGRG